MFFAIGFGAAMFPGAELGESRFRESVMIKAGLNDINEHLIAK